MKFNPLKGRLDNHRFHPMLVHFPSGLYPFSFVMDILGAVTENPDYAIAAMYSLMGAVGMSVVAMIYGAIDFLQINSNSKAWRTAGIHALLNVSWFILFSSLLFYRMKHEDGAPGWIYLTIMGFSITGLSFSNFLGGELIIRHRVGIDNMEENK